ncbi:MAG: hypothetical protein ACOVO9_08485 [Bacteroidia bacterium]
MYRFSRILSRYSTSIAALLSLGAIWYTGLYPGLFVFQGLALLSYFVNKKFTENTVEPRRFKVPIIGLNFLLFLVILWMSFVIIHDRILGDCC